MSNGDRNRPASSLHPRYDDHVRRSMTSASLRHAQCAVHDPSPRRSTRAAGVDGRRVVLEVRLRWRGHAGHRCDLLGASALLGCLSGVTHRVRWQAHLLFDYTTGNAPPSFCPDDRSRDNLGSDAHGNSGRCRKVCRDHRQRLLHHTGGEPQACESGRSGPAPRKLEYRQPHAVESRECGPDRCNPQRSVSRGCESSEGNARRG